MTFFHHSGYFVSMLGILLSCFYIFEKAVTYTASVKIKKLSVLWCLLGALLYAFWPSQIPPLLFRPIFCVLSIVFVWRLAEIKLNTVVSAFLMSFGVSYFFVYLATLFLGLIFGLFLGTEYEGSSPVDFNSPVYLLMFTLIAVLQLILSYLLFRIRRFRNGFPFLFEKHSLILALIVAGVFLVFVSLMTSPQESSNNSYAFLLLVVGVLIIGAGIIVWIRRGIRIFYRKKIRERGVELLEQELAEKEAEIRRLTEQNDALRVAGHKTNHRLTSLERGVAALARKIQDGGNLTEMGEELSVALEDVRRLSQDYQEGIGRIKGKRPLPSTKIKSIDNLFDYFAEQFADRGISFSLIVNGSIPYMAEHIIPQSKLETMIGDHLQNALTAISAVENSFRGVLAVLGLAGERYEFTVFDSGVAFEACTLIRLGTERVTTRPDTGGGIGFMTTFETMRECGASLVINEKKPYGADYSKSVAIRFDGKNRYIIETYRPGAFPADNDRCEVIGSITGT